WWQERVRKRYGLVARSCCRNHLFAGAGRYVNRRPSLIFRSPYVRRNSDAGTAMKRSVTLTTMAAFALTALIASASGAPEVASSSLVLITGGQFKNSKSNYYGKGVTVSDFYLGK